MTSAYPAHVGDADPADPFDDADDDLFASIDMLAPPPPKRRKQSDEVTADPFDSDDDQILGAVDAVERQKQTQGPSTSSAVQSGDDDAEWGTDDEQMCQIADELEITEEMFAEYEEGVPPENRFVTGIGRPHPLFLPEVVDKVFSYVSSPSTLRAARSVCTQWKDQLKTHPFEYSTFRNLSHVIERYPYGLGVMEGPSTSKPPLPHPSIAHISIADPCIVLMKPEVEEFIRVHGHNFKSVKLDANLYCKVHWKFVRSIVNASCSSLEQLELVGVTCVDSLISYSELYTKTLNLKKLIVKCKTEMERDHHHFSTVRTIEFDNRGYAIDRFSCHQDGGLIPRILRMSPNLTDLTLHYNFTSAAMYFAHIRVFGATFSNMTKLELIGVGIFAIEWRDLRMLNSCNFTSLKTLIIGPLQPTNCTTNLERFLERLAPTLEHLELRGVTRTANTRLGVVRLHFPELPLLKSFKATNMSRIRVGNLNFLYSAPALETLHLGWEPVPQRHKTNVFRSIVGLFNGVNQNEHLCLKSVHFSGSYAHVIDHNVAAGQLMNICPKLKFLGVSCRPADVVGCMNAYSVLPELEHLDISFGDEYSMLGVFQNVFKTVPKTVKRLSVHVTGDVVLRGRDLDGSDMALLELVIYGAVIHDSEAASLARSFTTKNTFTVFRNCSVVKPGLYNAARKRKTLDNVLLTLVNLHVLLDSTFRVI